MSKLSLDAYTLKIIAIVSMGVHHAAMILWQIFPMWIHIPLGFIRGITFPIMAFFVVEGFRRTSNVKKYMLRLLIFGAIAQGPYMLAFGIATLNIVFSIALGLACLLMYRGLYVNREKKALFVFLFVVICIKSTFIVEGGFAALIMIFLFNVIRDEMKRRTIPLIVWGAFSVVSVLMARVSLILLDVFSDFVDEASVMVEPAGVMAYEVMMMTQTFVLPLGTFLIIPLLRAYNGELGRRAKYLFYTFYPAHFAVLVLIAFALGLKSDITITSPWW